MLLTQRFQHVIDIFVSHCNFWLFYFDFIKRSNSYFWINFKGYNKFKVFAFFVYFRLNRRHPYWIQFFLHHGFEVFAGKIDRKSTRLNSSHVRISYAVFCLKKNKKKKKINNQIIIQ